MKKLKIYWTTFSLKCLDEIQGYIKKKTASETIANKLVSKLISRVEQLKDFPESGQQESLLKHLNQNSRYLVEGNYKIIYQFDGTNVIVTDVFHVKQNPSKIVKRKTRDK